MRESDGQEGLNPATDTTESTPHFHPDGETPETAPADAVLIAEAMPDGEDTDDLLVLPEEADPNLLDPELAALFEAPPIEAAAGPNGGIGGGGSSYNSDFGQIIAGLQASGVAPGVEGTGTPGADPFGASPGDDFLLGQPATSGQSLADAVSEGDTGGDDSFGGADDSLGGGGGEGGGGADGGEGGNGEPVGPGAEEGLFTNKADVVDLNEIDAGGYLDGTQYDALNQHDTVILPSNADEALEAGFATGTWFFGNNGHDHVTGGSLADLIDGGNGHDTLLGGGGADNLNGGSGNGRDSLDGGAGDDTLSGGNGRDTLLGGSGNDSLDGGKSNDSLDGGDDDDLLDGGHNHDLLLGGSGDDTLDGGSHHDTLTGGTGDDVMTGGSGKDVFAFSLASDEGSDLIVDFATGKNGDRLELSDLLDENSDSVIDEADLDAGAHSVSGTADKVTITFDSGTTVTLDGVNGTGVDSFADLLDMKINIDIV